PREAAARRRLGKRWVLRLRARHLRLPRRQRDPRARATRAAGRGRAARGLPARGVLGGDGHVPGSAASERGVAVGPARVGRGLSRALVVGASGQVGGAIYRVLGDAVGTYRSRSVAGLRHLDASDADALRRTIDETGAKTVFFPAAQPNVDWCEAHPAEAEAANLEPLRVALAVAAERAPFLPA